MDRKKVIVLSFAVLVFRLVFFYAVARGHYSSECNSKLWLHRVNSLERLNEMEDKYDNIEVDLVYRENGILDVTHDIDTTFNLSVEEYFSIMQRGNGKMWLDIKNLNADNVDAITMILEELVSKYGVVKERLIIESGQWQDLAKLTQKGYYTSMYVKYDKPQELDSRQLEGCIMNMRKVADSGCVRAISFPYWWYDTVREYLGRSIDLLTWQHRKTVPQLLLSPQGQRMLDDPMLKVILVKDKGNFYR